MTWNMFTISSIEKYYKMWPQKSPEQEKALKQVKRTTQVALSVRPWDLADLVVEGSVADKNVVKEPQLDLCM